MFGLPRSTPALLRRRGCSLKCGGVSIRQFSEKGDRGAARDRMPEKSGLEIRDITVLCSGARRAARPMRSSAGSCLKTARAGGKRYSGWAVLDMLEVQMLVLRAGRADGMKPAFPPAAEEMPDEIRQAYLRSH